MSEFTKKLRQAAETERAKGNQKVTSYRIPASKPQNVDVTPIENFDASRNVIDYKNNTVTTPGFYKQPTFAVVNTSGNTDNIRKDANPMFTKVSPTVSLQQLAAQKVDNDSKKKSAPLLSNDEYRKMIGNYNGGTTGTISAIKPTDKIDLSANSRKVAVLNNGVPSYEYVPASTPTLLEQLKNVYKHPTSSASAPEIISSALISTGNQKGIDRNKLYQTDNMSAQTRHDLRERAKSDPNNPLVRALNNPEAEGSEVYTSMSPAMQDRYNEIYATGGIGDAENFKRTSLDVVNNRIGTRDYNENLRDRSVVSKIGNQFASGFESGIQGIKDVPRALIGLENTRALTPNEYRAQAVRSDKNNSTLANIAYDIAQSTGNMAPGMIASYALGGVGGALATSASEAQKAAQIAQSVGSSVFALSQLGNTYMEDINAGKDGSSATLRSLQQAIDEEATNFLLGGITAFGGGALKNMLSNTKVAAAFNEGVNKLTKNDFGRKMLLGAADYLADMGSEALQEYVQFFTENLGKNLIYGENNSLNPLDPDAWYAALLGALNAGALNAPGAAIKTGKGFNSYVQNVNDNINSASDIMNSLDMDRASYATDNDYNKITKLEQLARDIVVRQENGEKLSLGQKMAYDNALNDLSTVKMAEEIDSEESVEPKTETAQNVPIKSTTKENTAPQLSSIESRAAAFNEGVRDTYINNYKYSDTNVVSYDENMRKAYEAARNGQTVEALANDNEFMDFYNRSNGNAAAVDAMFKETARVMEGNYVKEGNNVPGRRSDGPLSLSAGEQSGTVLKGTETDGRIRGVDQEAADVDARSIRVGEGVKAEEVIPAAKPGQEVYIPTSKTQDMIEGDKFAEEHGLKVKAWCGGQLKNIYDGFFRGCTVGGSGEVCAQADNKYAKYSQIVKHEVAENKLSRNDFKEILNKSILNRDAIVIVNGQRKNIVDMAVKVYMAKTNDTYANCYKELICDAHGMINQFEKVADRNAEYESFAKILQAAIEVINPIVSEKVEASNNRNTITENEKYKFSDSISKKLNPREITDNEVNELIENASFGIYEDNTYIPIKGHTPLVLNELLQRAKEFRDDIDILSIEDFPIIISAKKIRQAIEEVSNSDNKNKSHGIDPYDIVKIMKGLEKPNFLVYQKDNGRLAVGIKYKSNGVKNVAVILDLKNSKSPNYLNGYEGGMYNVAITMFSPDEMESYLKKENNIVIYEKGKSGSGSGSLVPSHSTEMPLSNTRLSHESYLDNGSYKNKTKNEFSSSLVNDSTIDELDNEYMEAVESGDMAKARELVEYWASVKEVSDLIPDETLTYKTRVKAAPKKTVKVYKTFTVDENGNPSALFVSSANKLPVGVWLDAKDTFHFKDQKNGRYYVPSTKNPNTQGGATGKSLQVSDISDSDVKKLEELGYLKRNKKGDLPKSITVLAYRPGWHAGDLPFFPQGGMQIEGSNYQNVHRYNQVVYECEMAFDEDYTNFTYTKDGQVKYKDMQSMPVDGGYKFATNPMANSSDIGSWFISGSLKINRALSEEECNKILNKNGYKSQEWQAFYDKDEYKKIKGEDAKKAYEKRIGNLDLERLKVDPNYSDYGKKTLATVTYDDEGNVIPLSERFNENSKDIRFSSSLVDEDTIGNTLTEQQKEYFSDSKIRTEDGKLKVMYHGTTNDFTVFDVKKARSSGLYGRGFYFTDSNSHAGQYGKSFEVYLNIKNPVDSNSDAHTFTKKQLKDFINYVADEEGIENYGYDATPNSILKSLWGKSDYGILQDINATCVGDFVATIKMFNEVNGTDYDGIVVPTETVAFYPEQIKLTSNQTPTTDKDMRFSSSFFDDITDDDLDMFAKSYETYTYAPDIESETDDMKEMNSLMDSEIETGKYEGREITDKLISDTVNKIAKQNSSELSEEQRDRVERGVKVLYSYLSESGKKASNTVTELATEIGEDILSSVTELDDSMRQAYPNVEKELKSYSLNVSDSTKKALARAYDNYANFHRKYFGKLTLASDGVEVDTAYNEMSSKYPELFPEDIHNPEDQLIRMAEVLDSLKPEKTNIQYGEEESFVVGQQILKEFFDPQNSGEYSKKLEEITKRLERDNEARIADLKVEQENMIQELKDKQAEGISNLKTTYQTQIDTLKYNHEKELNKIKADNNKQISELIQKNNGDRTKYESKLLELKAKQEANETALKLKHEDELKELRAKRDSRINDIKKSYQNRIDKLRADKNHKIAEIKLNEDWRRAEESARRLDSKARTRLLKLAKQLRGMKLNPQNSAEFKALVQDLDLVSKGISEKKVKELRDLKYAAKYQAELDPDFKELEYPRIEEIFKRLEKKRISEMTGAEVADLTEALLAIKTNQQNFNKALSNNLKYKIATYGNRIIEQQPKVKGINGKNELAAKIGKYNLNMLNPTRAFAAIDGYLPNGVFAELGKSLNDGQTKAKMFEMESQKMFDEVLKDKDFVNSFSEPTIDIGGGMKISKGMRISLYLHSLNRNNEKHIAYGGIRVPDAKLYAQGKYEQAYRYGKVIPISPSDLKALVADMTPQEKAFADVAYKFFNEKAPGAINEVSIALNGYEKASVEHYFPIKTDPNFTKKEISGLVKDGTIEGMGMLKERNKLAVNPVLLEDVSQVLTRQIENTGRYYGLAIPVRDFNKIYGYSTRHYKESVSQAVDKTWGKDGQNYINNVLRDIQNGGRNSDGGIFDILKSKYAGAVLSINPGVSIKQSASYPFAATVLDAKSLTKGLTTVFTKADYDYMDSITPWSYMRRKGMSGTEVGEVYKQKGIVEKNSALKRGKELLNWIQSVDVYTTNRLFAATEFYVQEHYPSLEVRGEKYNEKVAELYNEVLQRTQPSYDVMQRNEYLRNPNTAMKALTAFKTQTFNMGGEVLDAYGRAAAFRKLVKTGDVSEAQLKKANRALAKTVAATVASQATLVALGAFAKALMHQMKPYRDKDGEVTAESVSKRMGYDLATSFGGMFMLGSEVQQSLLAVLNSLNIIDTGDKMYDLTLPAFDSINDFRTSLSSWTQALSKYLEDPTQENNKKLMQKSARLGMNGLIVNGISANNIYNIINAVHLWLEDAKNGELGSFEAGEGILGLSDTSNSSTVLYDRTFDALYEDKDQAKFLENYNKLAKIKGNKEVDSQLVTRLKGTSEINEAAKAYASGNDERAKTILADFIKNRKFDGSVEPLVYKAFDSVVNKLSDDKEKTTDYEPKTSSSAAVYGSEKEQKWIDSGLNPVDYRTYNNQLKQFSGDDKQEQYTEYIHSLNVNEETARMLWEMAGASASTFDDKYVNFVPRTEEEKLAAKEMKETKAAVKAAYNEAKGADTDGHFSTKEQYDFAEDYARQNPDYDAEDVWLANATKASKEKYDKFSDAGGSWEQFGDILEIDQIPADKNSKGNAINGSKKKKVAKAIMSEFSSDALREIAWDMCGYTKDTLKGYTASAKYKK